MTDSQFSRQVQRLHRLTVYGRWIFVGVCWAVIAPLSLWGFRDDIELLRQYFTWTALRYALAYHFHASIALAFCIGITGAVLVWQSRNILRGLPEREKLQLEKKVREIQTAGPRHPLWRWVMGK